MGWKARLALLRCSRPRCRMTALTLLVDRPDPERDQGSPRPGCTADQTAAGPRPGRSCESFGMPSTQSFAAWGATGTGTAIFLVDTFKYSQGKFHAGAFVGNVAVPLVLSVLTSVGRGVATWQTRGTLPGVREPDAGRRRLADRLRHGRPPRPRLHASSSAPTAGTATASSAGEAPQSAEHRLPHHRLPNRKPQRPGPARSLAPRSLALAARSLALPVRFVSAYARRHGGRDQGVHGRIDEVRRGRRARRRRRRSAGRCSPLRLLVVTDLVPAGPVQRRARARPRGSLRVDPARFDDLFTRIRPRIAIEVPSVLAEGRPARVDLSPTSLKSFRPDGLLAEVPLLRSLLDGRMVLERLRDGQVSPDQAQQRARPAVERVALRARGSRPPAAGARRPSCRRAGRREPGALARRRRRERRLASSTWST